MGDYVIIAEIIGTIAFAISGAMIAIDNKLDLLGVIVLGSATAVGGGALRDILLGTNPPNMFTNPLYVIIAIFTTLIVFLVCKFSKNLSIFTKQWGKTTLCVIDAIGLGVFAVVGAIVTYDKGHSNFLLVLFCSTLTAVGGGIIRDLLAGKIPEIFRRHIYAVAAMIGGISFVIFHKYSVNIHISIIISSLIVIIVRLFAYHYKWSLPRVELKK